jgi:hypothetical protein
MTRTARTVIASGLGLVAWWMASPGVASHATPAVSAAAAGPAGLFVTAETCFACHTGMVTPAGEDISFGPQWRPSMMANAARDPYWQAAVRREVTEHPHAQALIEDECSACHMPMARVESKAAGHEGLVFAHLPIGGAATAAAALAADGVSCSVCHQIGPEKLGTRESFTGGFVVDPGPNAGRRRAFGPFEVDAGRARVMQSASGFVPTKAGHTGESELCATCHTLITQAFDRNGKVVGELPEQVPYQEWAHSAYKATRSCQTCHMPVVEGEVPVTPVLGPPRQGVSRHAFRGGNSFMIRMLNRNRAELGVTASPQELDAAASRNAEHLSSDTASLTIARAGEQDGRVVADIAIANLAGHKLPTAYPSRRVWLHVVVRDRDGAVVFESGRVEPSGRIAGNDNDEHGSRFEPHYAQVERPDQVQIYESVMVGADGAVTTGLLSAVRYAKDNRLLPSGFDKATAPADVAVHGEAARDADFGAGGDRVRYVVAVPRDRGPYRVDADLYYQTIGFRWAENLRAFTTAEPSRFVWLYGEMAQGAATLLARASALAARPTNTGN